MPQPLSLGICIEKVGKPRRHSCFPGIIREAVCIVFDCRDALLVQLKGDSEKRFTMLEAGPDVVIEARNIYGH